MLRRHRGNVGKNEYGGLGNGSSTDSAVPVAVIPNGALAGKFANSVAAGYGHTLVLCTDGKIVAWGWNSNGQLGNGSTTSSSVPVAVVTTGTALENKTVIAVAAGDYCSIALCSDGTVATWGNNQFGQLGTGNKNQYITPIAVKTASTALSGKTVTKISAGYQHVLALCSDGTVVAWGENGLGQFGNNGTTASTSAVSCQTSGTALEGKTVTAIAAGDYHSLALCSDGTVAAWGHNGSGQLGAPFSVSRSLVPISLNQSGVLATKTVVKVEAGTTHSLLVCSDGSLAAVGDSSSGKLGVAPLSSYVTGTPITVATASTALAAKTVLKAVGGNGHTLALCSDGSVACWGENKRGQVGNRGLMMVASPVNVNASGPLAGKTIVFASVGTSIGIALCSDGTVATWGNYNPTSSPPGGSKVPVSVEGTGALAGKTVIAVAAGSQFFALCSDGTLTTWIGTLLPAVVNSGVLSGRTVVAMTVGNSHQLALCSDGTLAAWGQNGSGQLGNNATTTSNAPVAVVRTGVLSGKVVTGMACGYYHSIVVCDDGTVAVWGGNTTGALGDNSTTNSLVPIGIYTSGVLAGKFVTKVGAANTRTTVVCSDGTVANWGSPNLSKGPLTRSSSPIAVTSGVLSGLAVNGVACGTVHTTVWCANGTLAGWGDNYSGHLGTGNNVSTDDPVAAGQAALSAGERYIFAVSGANAQHTLAIVASPPAAPIVETLAATSINSTGATLRGIVHGHGENAIAAFDFGIDSSFGSSIGASPSTVGGSTGTPVSAVLTGLQSQTIYHFRVKGTNTSGTSRGGDLTFTTPSTDASLAALTASTAFSPAFAASTLAYSTSVGFSVNSLALTPTTTEPHATLQVQVGSGSFVSVSSGSSTGSLALETNGATVIRVKVIAEDGSTTKTYVITVAAKTAFQQWQLANFDAAQAGTGQTEDFDGDGLRNLMEFGFGTNPTAFTKAGPLSYTGNVITPGGITSEVIAGVPMAEFIRRSDYVEAGLTYKVEFSAKLLAWETINVAQTVLATDGTYEVVGMAYPKLADGSRSKFFRVTVSVTP
ncbi:MAG: repeat domain protein [Verrucomicrobiaceae bacterium]|nr:repeat domain protein [Verrucomicrobiaceae bacterium]